MADIQGLLDKYKHIDGERFFAEVFNGRDYGVVKDVKGKVCIDAGALAGEFPAYVYDNFDTFYCIEPYSAHYEELETNVRDFKMDKVIPLRIILVGDNKDAKVQVGSRGGHHTNREGTEVVEIRTLAEFVAEHNIDKVDLLKIDVEGAERDIFSSSDFKNVYHKFPMIVGEHLAHYGGDSLIALGYKATNHLYTL